MTKKEKPNWKEFYAERKEAGKRIDPKTSTLFCKYAMEIDPYGVIGDIPPEYQCCGKMWFAYSPEEGAIWTEHLPEKTLKTLIRIAREKEVTIYEDIAF